MKVHHPGFHSGRDQPFGLADQDAAIDAYLDGLLRDPDSEPCWSTDVTRDVVDDDYDEDFTEEAVADFERIKRPLGWSLVDLSKYKTEVIGKRAPEETVPLSDQPENQVQTTTPDISLHVADSADPVVEQQESIDMSSEAVSSDELSLEMVSEESVELPEESETPVSITQADSSVEVLVASAPKIESAWQVFALGHLKVALPRAEIFDIVDGSFLRPIPGAPASVAGAVSYQDRSRMILSLAAWLPKVTSDARVVLLGAQGLWGVRVGAELTDLTWDEAQTRWRDASERHAGRPWLAGVNRSAGVAFLAVESLRSALSASR